MFLFRWGSKIYVQNQSGPSNSILHRFCLTRGSTLTSQDYDPSSVVYVLTYHLVPRAIWPYYVKWNFSTFCGLSRSTTYLYLPQGRIGPLDPRSYPQGGVQIYPMANLLHKMWKQKYPPPNSDLKKLNPSMVLTYYLTYCKVAGSNTIRLEAHTGFFRLLISNAHYIELVTIRIRYEHLQ